MYTKFMLLLKIRLFSKRTITLLFHDGGRYHIETSPLICSANQWTGFYMLTASVMKVLRASGSPGKTAVKLKEKVI